MTISLVAHPPSPRMITPHSPAAIHPLLISCSPGPPDRRGPEHLKGKLHGSQTGRSGSRAVAAGTVPSAPRPGIPSGMRARWMNAHWLSAWRFAASSDAICDLSRFTGNFAGHDAPGGYAYRAVAAAPVSQITVQGMSGIA